jgi:hypothetical protein
MMTKPEWSKLCRRAAKARWAKARNSLKLVVQFRKRAAAEAVM